MALCSTYRLRDIIRRSPDRWFHHCSGARSSVRRSSSTSRKHVASCASSSRGRAPIHVSVPFKSDQQLREVAGRRRMWVSLSRSACVGPPRQHRAADRMEQGRHGALLVLRRYGGRQLAGPSSVQRQRCLVPLTANERILVLSDVAWGLAYLHWGGACHSP